MNDSSKTTWIVAGSCALLIMVGWLIWLSQGYGEVSQTGYQYAMALVSACNRQDVPRLEGIVASINEAVAAKQLPPYDAKMLLRIAERALDGDWQWSSREIRRLMLAQIR